MEKQEMFEKIFVKLLKGNQKWKLVPEDINLKALEADYDSIVELYFTNTEEENWNHIATKSSQKTTFLVGKYITRYYFDEEEYSLEANYFFGFAKRITTEFIEPEFLMSVSDGSFEPMVIDGNYKVIRDLFDKAKSSTFDFKDILDELD